MESTKRADRKRRQAGREKQKPLCQSARAQRQGALSRAGTWKQAAECCARHCQQQAMDYLPPAYAALNLPVCLSMTAQMYGCLELTEWRTCVVCWRAWYDLPGDQDFAEIKLGRKERPAHWFNVADSAIVGEKRRGAVNQWRLGGAASPEDACRYLYENYPEDEVKRILDRLVSKSSKRVITICGECGKYVGADLRLPAPEDEMRLCDYLVDPIYSAASTQGLHYSADRAASICWSYLQLPAKGDRVPLPLASDARRYAICSSAPTEVQGPFAGEGTLQGRGAEVAVGV